MSPDVSAVAQNYDRHIERSIRCPGITQNGFRCNKLAAKVMFTVSAPKSLVVDSGVVSGILSQLEIKIGIETKCHRCRNMVRDLTVV